MSTRDEVNAVVYERMVEAMGHTIGEPLDPVSAAEIVSASVAAARGPSCSARYVVDNPTTIIEDREIKGHLEPCPCLACQRLVAQLQENET